MSRGAVLLVGTRKGAFILDGDAARRSWSIRGPFCGGFSIPDVDASSVREVIAALDRAAPGIADRLIRAGPSIREHINVFVDGDLADLDTPVHPGSTVHVIPAVSGGE